MGESQAGSVRTSFLQSSIPTKAEWTASLMLSPTERAASERTATEKFAIPHHGNEEYSAGGMVFSVPTGHCAGSYDGVVISTDLEPDDAIALLALAPRLRGVPLLVIVGQGAVDKRQMAASMLASFGLDKCATVAQGRDSKASWPSAVSTCYDGLGRQTAATILPADDETSITTHLEAFLAKCSTPFALLLKPPHEFLRVSAAMLQRTAGAMYGSFNLAELREGMCAAEPTLTEDMCHTQQEVLLRSFKAMLWVERSLSVGRDGMLDTVATPTAWPLLEEHPSVLQHVLHWNAVTLKTMGKKLGAVAADTAAALEGDGAVLGPTHYGAVEAVVEKADKKVQVMLAIARCQGRQVCHADTLVATCLMDDAGALAAFMRRCHPGHDAKFKPTFTADPSSNVAALLAEPGLAREDLFQKSVAILLDGLRGAHQL